MKLRNILILQNKVDLVRESEALEQQKDIAKFIEGEWMEDGGRVDTGESERNALWAFFTMDSVIDSETHIYPQPSLSNE